MESSKDAASPSLGKKETTDQSSLEAGESTEGLCGISSYLSAGPRLIGALKARYSDFVVREVALDGTVARLEALKEEEKEEEDKVTTEPDAASQSNSARVLRCAESLRKLFDLGTEEEAEKCSKELVDFLMKHEKHEGQEVDKEQASQQQQQQGTPSSYTLPEVSSKSVRADLHRCVREHLAGIAVTDTNEGRVRVLPEALKGEANSFGMASSKGRGKGGRGGGGKRKRGADDNHYGPGGSAGMGKVKPWPPSRPDFLSFVLYKENTDTMAAVSDLSKCTASAKNGKRGFGYSGTKDKRAVTTQFCTVYRKEPKELDWVNGKYEKYGGPSSGIVRVGSYSYVSAALKLGSLKGNMFEIALRNIRDADGGNDGVEALFKGNCDRMKESGFLNYFGMQRFGKHIDNHRVGAHLIRGRFESAVNLIMKVRENGDERSDILKARRAWAERRPGENCKAAGSAMLGFQKSSGEHSVMRYLAEGDKRSEDFRGAIFSMPRNMRLMYLHALQSILWNKVATARFEKHGAKVVAGDLVLVKSGDAAASAKDGGETSGANVAPEGSSGGEGRVTQLSSKVVVEVEAGKESLYSLRDVVVAMPGNKVKTGAACESMYGDAFVDVGLCEEGGEHDMEKLFTSDVREFCLGGDYRRLVQSVDDLTYEFVRYDDPVEPLIKTDFMKVKGLNVPLSAAAAAGDNETQAQASGGTGKISGLVVSFTLPSSSYATIAVRELTKCPQTTEFQKTIKLLGGRDK